MPLFNIHQDTRTMLLEYPFFVNDAYFQIFITVLLKRNHIGYFGSIGLVPFPIVETFSLHLFIHNILSLKEPFKKGDQRNSDEL